MVIPKKKQNTPLDFKADLWDCANKLRNQMDAAEYKHLVLGLIFLKYISDSFVEQQKKVMEMISNPKNIEFYLEPELREEALEDKDYYEQDVIFWVPPKARWEYIQKNAKVPKIFNEGQLIDEALVSIENENPSLKGKLDKRFTAALLEPGTKGQLVDVISKIGFNSNEKDRDILGEVYEYFLGKFAVLEGKNAGSFYTPSHVVKLLVAILSPNKGRVYDPCCGSGGMFVQSEDFIRNHGGKLDDISIYGQESNPTTWRLAAINLAIRGISANLGKEPRDTFAADQHPDQKFDYILANPPFNISEWSGEKYDNDPRWVYGRPPIGNANFAWLQHMLWKLRPGGQAGIVLANGSMSSNTSNEGNIREEMVRKDVVEIMIALPSQLFLNTQISVCLWFLTNDKTKKGRDRRGETLFIDARQIGKMKSRVERILTTEDISKIADTVDSWRNKEDFVGVEGFCHNANFEEIERNGFILIPGRYVGTLEEEDDDESFDEKMKKLTFLLKEQQEEGAKLDKQISNHLKRIGYG